MSTIPSLIGASLLLAFSVCHARAASPTQAAGWIETGRASFYANFWQGRRTASGALFDNQELTAAHPWLPFGTRVRVMVEKTGREVVVTITDRIFYNHRVLDLSQRAARLLGITRQGIAQVVITPE